MADQFLTQTSPGRRAAAHSIGDRYPEMALGTMLHFTAMVGILWNLSAPLSERSRALVDIVIVAA
jgi:hypothetical protein